ncbi:MAG: BMC domain-containing protein, partial [Spartobacteria bacterium]|nr:BMC domain-containing protein [Spartobacteria bacterium]
GALAILETDTVSSNLRAAEMALKGTPVALIEVRLGDTQMGGRGLSIFQGDLHDIEAAMDIATGFLTAKNYHFVHRILTSPHEAMIAQMNTSTRFNQALNLELEDGEHRLA